MSGLQVLSVTPVLAAMDLPIDGYEKMGVVALLVLAVIAVWREGNKRQDKLESIIDRNTAAMTEVKDALRDCHASKRG